VSETAIKPERPFLVFNHYHICIFEKWIPWHVSLRVQIANYFVKKYVRLGRNLHDLVSQNAFKKGRFFKDAIIIDINGRRFPVLGVIKGKRHRNIFNLWGLLRGPNGYRFHFEFVTGEPTQITLDEARIEIVDLICSRRWAGQTGGSPAEFRKYQLTKKNMAEFIEGISFYGRWPY
jgi:hypothetical protein